MIDIMTVRTLCLVIKGNQVLLGKKKPTEKNKVFGVGYYNGYGGKIKQGESLEQASVRELLEECGIVAEPEYLEKAAELTFTFPHKPEWDQVVHVYLVYKWEGEPKESDEMTAEWFDLDKVPYDKMWEADAHWVKQVLAGKYVTASFVYGEGNKLIKHEIKAS